jgi:hypothetical protein
MIGIGFKIIAMLPQTEMLYVSKYVLCIEMIFLYFYIFFVYFIFKFRFRFIRLILVPTNSHVNLKQNLVV